VEGKNVRETSQRITNSWPLQPDEIPLRGEVKEKRVSRSSRMGIFPKKDGFSYSHDWVNSEGGFASNGVAGHVGTASGKGDVLKRGKRETACMCT